MTLRGNPMVVLVRKEMLQFLRARLMLLLIAYLYTAEVVMCTFAMSFDIRDLPTVFADRSGSPSSRLLEDAFRSSGYFRIVHETSDEEDIARLLDSGQALAALVVPPEFSERQEKGTPVHVQLLLDGSNSNAATIAQGYAQKIVHRYALEEMLERHRGWSPPIGHRPRVWYNSELDYSHFMVLSMIALAGMMVGVVTAASGIVREKESGTIEQLLLAPIRPAQIIAAKMAPPLAVVMVALLPSLLIAKLVGVPLRGSLGLFYVFSFVFLLSSMGMGIFFATVTETMQQALLVSFFALFPILFLSGTVVPLESMPVSLQYLAELSPLRHYMGAIVGLFFKGSGLDVLWPHLVALVVVGAVLLSVALVRFRRSLD